MIISRWLGKKVRSRPYLKHIEIKVVVINVEMIIDNSCTIQTRKGKKEGKYIIKIFYALNTILNFDPKKIKYRVLRLNLYFGYWYGKNKA